MGNINDLKQEILELTAENEQLKTRALKTGEVIREFEESKDRFKAVFEASRMGNKIIASDLKILQVNPALVKLLGYSSKEEIVETVILDYSPEEQHTEWRYLQKQLWEHSTPSCSLETTLIRKDGSIIWCQVTSILFKDKGETLGYTIIEDITEQYKLRKQKEDFIGVASHELKTPVTSLKATLQLMNRVLDKQGGVPDEIINLGRRAEKSTDKLTFLISDLLKLTELEQGQLSIYRTTFKLSEVMENCTNYISAEGSGQVNIEGDLSIIIYADQQKLEQVLINLINNAIKYTTGIFAITIQVEQLPEHVKITVIDQGQGISPEHFSKVFDRYFRIDEKKFQSSGLGLGLYISGEIIRRHGGEIGVRSELGIGSSFWFTLPMRKR